MFIKKILVVLLALFLLNFANFVVAPDFVYAATPEEQADNDANMFRGLMILGGLALLIYIVGSSSGRANNSTPNHKYVSSSVKLPSEGQATSLKKTENNAHGVDIKLDFAKFGIRSDVNNELFSELKDEWRSPELKMGYTW